MATAQKRVLKICEILPAMGRCGELVMRISALWATAGNFTLRNRPLHSILLCTMGSGGQVTFEK